MLIAFVSPLRSLFDVAAMKKSSTPTIYNDPPECRPTDGCPEESESEVEPLECNSFGEQICLCSYPLNCLSGIFFDVVLGVPILMNSPSKTFTDSCHRSSSTRANIQFSHRSETSGSTDVSADGEPHEPLRPGARSGLALLGGCSISG